MTQDEIRYQELKDKLKTAGCNLDFGKCNCVGYDLPNEYDNIIIPYLGTFQREGINEHVIRCITKSKKYNLIPIILEQIEYTQQSFYRSTLCDALYVIGYNENYFADYMHIAGNMNYGWTRSMVVLLLGRSKHKEAADLLLQQMCNRDYDVLMHTMSALRKFKYEYVYNEVKKFADYLVSDDGKQRYINDMRKRAYVGDNFFFLINKDGTLKEKAVFNDTQQSYKALVKELNKILIWHNEEKSKDEMKLK